MTLTETKRKPGRPKGLPKSGGRKKGVPNRITRDVREMILKRGKPVELLCDIARGKKIRVGPQAGPGEPEYYYPSPAERQAAARDLLPYVAAKYQQLTGADDADLFPAQPDNKSLAGAVMSILQDGGADVAEFLGNSDEPDSQPDPALNSGDSSASQTGCEPPIFSAPPENDGPEKFPNGAAIEPVEIEATGERKWGIYDSIGVLHGYRRNRDDAVALARNIPTPSLDPEPEQQEVCK